jgi:hypothetical protein
VVADRLIDVSFERPGAGVAAVEFGGFVEGVEGGAAVALVDEGLGFVAPGHGAARVDDHGVAVDIHGSCVIADERTRVAQAVPGLKALRIIRQRLGIRGDRLLRPVYVEQRIGLAVPGCPT